MNVEQHFAAGSNDTATIPEYKDGGGDDDDDEDERDRDGEEAKKHAWGYWNDD